VTVAAHTEHLPLPGLIAAAPSDDARARLVAARILSSFEAFYEEFRRLTWLAQSCFEARDHAAAVAHAQARLSLYNGTVYALADELRAAYPSLAEHEPLWSMVEAAFLPQVGGRYEGDLAVAYLHSVMRRVHSGEWRPVDYGFGNLRRPAVRREDVFVNHDCRLPVSPAIVRNLLQSGELATPFCDPGRDSELVAARIDEVLASDASLVLERIEMIRGCFFRNRGAYLVGRLAFRDGRYKPLVLALQNGHEGIVTRAVIATIPHVHNLFSSTQAAFQVTNLHYHEISEFLYTIMPRRPLGLQYSTIGFHHVSKVAVMNEITQQLGRTGEVLDTAPGSPGTVAIAFSAPCLSYVLKVIRDRPTAGYKWDSFAGAEAVLGKYRRVHEINRTGSMLDNTIYYNLKLDRAWFDPALLEELVAAAGNAVRLQGDAVIFKYLVVQRTLMPLNIYLQLAAPDKALRVISNLGHCIKNNAAANVFNRDFDVRNYGVTRYLKVYLYDFDAVEALTDVKVRTNTDRIDGEEGVPDWFFEPGHVFLPEEIEAGLRVADRDLRREFRAEHRDLLTTGYWEAMQAAHRQGHFPGIHTYPESCYLENPPAGLVADE
jgi:isocitrate dehydrogenase kinase/phosphatase